MSGMAHTLPGPPLAGLASLGLGPPTQKDWDQMSMYSQRTDRSVNRARMYHMDRAGMKITRLSFSFFLMLSFKPTSYFDMICVLETTWKKKTFFWPNNLGSIGGGFIPEDARSHISHLSSKSRVPSLADLTGKPGPYPGLGTGLGAGLGFSRPGIQFSSKISFHKTRLFFL